jgi:hypothetical protein
MYFLSLIVPDVRVLLQVVCLEIIMWTTNQRYVCVWIRFDITNTLIGNIKNGDWIFMCRHKSPNSHQKFFQSTCFGLSVSVALNGFVNASISPT